jgi:DNA-binding winged helix-turn-helix (wHTH) protein/tetratricopeptide (TPR) repeat protein
VVLWTQPSRRFFRFDAFEVDLWTGELRRNGAKLKVQDQPLKVLAMLLARPGELVTREQLREGLWSNDTFVDFDRGLNTAVNRLRAAINDSAEKPRFVETVGRRGYRFIAPVANSGSGNKKPAAEGLAPSDHVYEWPSDDRFIASVSSEEAKETRLPESSKQALEKPRGLNKKLWRVLILVFAVFLVVTIATGLYHHLYSGKPINDKDTIVLADFANSTGELIFDDTLKQALAMQLEQSPFLKTLSDQRVRDTLSLMRRSPRDRLDEQTARDVCQRAGSRAALVGSIASLGSQYVLGLNAVDCQTGDSLARQEVQAASKEQVLKALDLATTKLRQQLGESLTSIQRFDTPIEQATTTSLEALKAYSIGRKIQSERGDAAIPSYKRAIELDPVFAMAYANLGVLYSNTGEPDLASKNIHKAYELRERVSDLERFYISAFYYMLVTGEQEKAIQVFDLWAKTYPRDHKPHGNLGDIYGFLGQWEHAVTETEAALRLEPTIVHWHNNLMQEYLALNRLERAESVFDQAQARNLDAWELRLYMYYLAFLRGDVLTMETQVSWGAGKPREEDPLLSAQSDTEAYHGHLEKAREFSQRAVDSARHTGENETAALWQANLAVREAEFGNSVQAREAAYAALAIAPGRDVKVLTALGLARSGDTASARKLSRELEDGYEADTLINSYWLPTIQAAIELDLKNPVQALQRLQVATSYELGAGPPFQIGTLYPVYMRGQAYLAADKNDEAIVEFRKILDHRGIIVNFPLSALAHLQLGRAYALAGDRAKAQNAYKDFLSLWKDADLDIPILKQAKAEYAKLQ